MTPEQAAAAKAKNWNPCYLDYIDPSNPDPEQAVWYSYEGGDLSGIYQPKANQQDDTYYSVSGIRQQGQPTRKGLYIKNNKKILMK